MARPFDDMPDFTADDVNKILQEIATNSDPRAVLEDNGVDISGISEPADEGGDSAGEWDDCVTVILSHEYNSPHHAMHCLLGFYQLMLDATRPSGSHVDVLSPMGFHRLFLALWFLSKIRDAEAIID